MSLSWIERARRRLAPATSAGISIGRDYVGCCKLAAANGAWRVDSLAETKLDRTLFSGAPSVQATAALTTALTTLAGDLRRRYIPVHVSLPDAATRVAVFELEEIPKSRAAQLKLVEFRFARETGGTTSICRGQVLGAEGGKKFLLGMAFDEPWLRCVTEALAGAGIVAWSVSANACRQFNVFHDQVISTAGALVTLAPDSWSLWLWDAHGRLRYARSRWRMSGDDHAEIAAEIERSILAYVHADTERAVARVHVVAANEIDAMAAALNQRMRSSCEPLSVSDAVRFDGYPASATASATAVLAAALDR